ncbi:hemerythrin domain-containing protein [Actinoplanes sp. NPDC051343]|uniref:hemerythrin domain-containing protein n=1 Tax=Actinoplanes sp. NPDC051343 TaxID=3363906 RepID=UPI0037B2EDCC
MGNTTTTVLADSRDMIGAHVNFRREFAALPAAIRRVVAGDTAQAATVGAHAEFLVDLLHHHHHGEDAGVWPRLRERCPGQVQELVEIMEEQHAGLDQALENIKARTQRWVVTANVDDGRALAKVCEDLLGPLTEHLDLEEAEVLPLIDRYLTDAEWKGIVRGEAATIPKAQLPLVFGMMLYDADDVTQSMMKTNVPALIWPFFSRIARRRYAKHAQAIHGTPTPPHFSR